MMLRGADAPAPGVEERSDEAAGAGGAPGRRAGEPPLRRSPAGRPRRHPDPPAALTGGIPEGPAEHRQVAPRPPVPGPTPDGLAPHRTPRGRPRNASPPPRTAGPHPYPGKASRATPSLIVTVPSPNQLARDFWIGLANGDRVDF